MSNCSHWWGQRWNEYKSEPGTVWILGALVAIYLGIVSDIVVLHFGIAPSIRSGLFRVGPVAATYYMSRAVSAAWKARSTFLFFFYTALVIFYMGTQMCLAFAEGNVLGPRYYFALLAVIWPVAGIVTLAAAWYWRRATRA